MLHRLLSRWTITVGLLRRPYKANLLSLLVVALCYLRGSCRFFSFAPSCCSCALSLRRLHYSSPSLIFPWELSWNGCLFRPFPRSFLAFLYVHYDSRLIVASGVSIFTIFALKIPLFLSEYVIINVYSAMQRENNRKFPPISVKFIALTNNFFKCRKKIQGIRCCRHIL